MCGIVGLWRKGGSVTREELAALAGIMRHRGPDSSGEAVFAASGVGTGAEVGLGHRRLAIIDLSPGGGQPMTRGSLTLAFNGEIYNYLELRGELSATGAEFSSASDTEVLLEAWRQWGPACLVKLNGIFAFLLWDDESKRLFAARDHLGVKPLHWVQREGLLAFASEAPLLARYSTKAGRIDMLKAREFLVAGRTETGDTTYFPGVNRLPAGALMEAWEEGATIRRFWAPSSDVLAAGDLCFEEAAGTFRDLFVSSVSLQMRADVPVACCLSGGLDSSTVVSVAARRSPYRMAAFTARFEDTSMDEWTWARRVHEASPVTAFAVPVGARGFFSNLRAVVRAQGEPFGTPGIYAQWEVMRAIAGEGLRVVLDGQGGDELLCGYAKYFYYGLNDIIEARRWGEALLWIASGLMYGRHGLLDWAAARRYLPGGLGTRFLSEELLRPELASLDDETDLERPRGGVREQQRLDLVRYSLPALLRFEDRNSMAHSVESRVPFLDPRLVEFCLSLPTKYKVDGGRSKQILREAMVEEVPAAILQRRTKLGFGGSYSSWVRELSADLEEWASDSARPIFRLVRPEAVRSLVRHADPVVFRVLILDAWMTEFEVAV